MVKETVIELFLRQVPWFGKTNFDDLIVQLIVHHYYYHYHPSRHLPAQNLKALEESVNLS